jgi:hypothetical protein
MNDHDKFRDELINSFGKVMHCGICQSVAKQGLPQPGWVGKKYMPGSGLVVILQNPAAKPKKVNQQAEDKTQCLLQEFKTNPSLESYEKLTDFIFSWMTGELDGKAWTKWKHPVKKLIDSTERLAWINAARVRTPGEQRKDDPVTSEQAKDGLKHLQMELSILRPKAIVTFGKNARLAIENLTETSAIPQKTIIRNLPLRPVRTDDIQMVRQYLFESGIDI